MYKFARVSLYLLPLAYFSFCGAQVQYGTTVPQYNYQQPNAGQQYYYQDPNINQPQNYYQEQYPQYQYQPQYQQQYPQPQYQPTPREAPYQGMRLPNYNPV